MGWSSRAIKEPALTNKAVMKRVQAALLGKKTIFNSQEERDFANNLIKKMKNNGETDSKTYKDLKRNYYRTTFLHIS